MRFTHVVVGVALVGALFGSPAFAGAGSQATGSAQLSDETIESRIEAILKKEPLLAARDIDVESERGRVTLTGRVKTADEKARAAVVAKIDGVATVVNELEVDPKVDVSRTDRAAAKTKEGLNKAVDATVKGAEKAKEGVQAGVGEGAKAVGKAADKTGEALGTAGEKVTDASLTTRVKNGFTKEPLLKDTSIAVETSARVVTLRGTVVSAAVKTKAEEIAKATEGVARVVSELVVKP
jgi:hyperosmotically inducible protein